TTSDLVANEQGIINVWKGTYPGGVTGDGLEVLVAKADSSAAADVDDSMSASIAEIKKIPAPFDQNLTQDAPDDGPGRTAIKTSIDNLGTQTDNLVAAAKAMGLTIEVT
ncbi:MAG: imelysin family protein, partial [Acidimicrobiales bacterium]